MLNPCVLIVDDSESIQQYVQDTLTDEGYRVIHAKDGAEGLALVIEQHPDLILLDMYMPDIDGWAFLSAYPRTPTPHVPIIAMSADINVKRMPGVQAGLAKPFTIDGLLTLVKRYLPQDAPSN